MLRITTRTDSTETVFELEGTLTGAWVKELEACWRISVAPHQPLKVALKAVTFVDSLGIELLAQMHRQGAEIVAEGCMMKAIVEDIVTKDRS